MANEIDLIVGSEAFAQISKLLTELGKVDTKLGELATSFGNLGKGATNPSDSAALKTLTDNNAKLNAEILKLSKSYDELNKKIAEGSTEIAKRSRYTTQEATDLRLVNKELTLQNTKASELAGAYEKLSAAHKIARESAANLGVIQGTNSKAFLEAAASANNYDKKLKEIDQQLGNHGRHVGNYSRSWNGLGNSINQLTREAPAFANSLNTGFMALSNNIPILADEINNLKLRNQELAAAGKPTESIFKQVASSFFSWQTLLSLGVTLLTIYGGKLVELMTAGEGAAKSADLLNKAFEDKSVSNASELVEELRINIQLAKDGFLDKEKVIEQYNETIGKTTGLVSTLDQAESELTKNGNAYIKMTLYKAAANLALEEASKKTLEAEKSKRKSLEEFASWAEGSNRAIKQYGETDEDVDRRNSKLRVKRKQDEIKINTDAAKANISIAKKFQTDAAKIAKDFKFNFFEDTKEEKPKKQKKEETEKKVLRFEEVKSEKDLQQAKIQTNKIELESVDLDKLTTEEKIINRQKLSRVQLEAIESVRKEEIAVADKKQKDDKLENDRALKNETITREQHNKNIEDINQTHKNVTEKIDVEASNKKKQLAFSDFKYQEDLLKKDAENVQKYKINQFEAEKLAQKQLSEDNRKNEKLTSAERIAAFKEFKRISEEELKAQRDFALSKTVIKTEQDLINQEYQKGVELLNDMSNPLEAIKNKTADWLKGFTSEGLDNPLKAFGMESAKMFLDIGANGESTFTTMYKNAEEGREKFQVAFGAISEVGQGAFNAIAQASMAQYEQEYARLESQKETSLKFAGDSAAAKEKIEADYAAKKKQIDKRKFEEDKKIKMINIVIDTAQAVVAALPNIPLSVIVGVLGAVQLGMVAAQQFPAYAEGTDNHIGGLMLVNDGKGSNYEEKVILPNGKVIRPQGRNVLMDAPKGTKVLNHEQQLFEMLQSNNISMLPQQSSGMTPEEMDLILGKHFGNIKTQNTIFDKNGFQTYVRNGNSITRSNSNRSQAIGISV
jgi:hypothetical protein